MLHIVYYYNVKLFGLRGGEHSNITEANFDVGSDFIRFEENVVKKFHDGFPVLKYKPRLETEHVCHPLNGKHESWLDETYSLYIESVQACSNELTAFYLKPNFKVFFFFDKKPVGIETLNNIIPPPYKEGSLKHKTNHCLRVSCPSILFNAGVEERVIRDRTGHRSNAVFNYEKIP